MAGNGGMQTEEMYESGMDEPFKAPGGAAANGGHKQLVNQDEDDITDAIISATPYRAIDMSNEDDSHVQGIYRERDWAGS